MAGIAGVAICGDEYSGALAGFGTRWRFGDGIAFVKDCSGTLVSSSHARGLARIPSLLYKVDRRISQDQMMVKLPTGPKNAHFRAAVPGGKLVFWGFNAKACAVCLHLYC